MSPYLADLSYKLDDVHANPSNSVAQPEHNRTFDNYVISFAIILITILSI